MTWQGGTAAALASAPSPKGSTASSGNVLPPEGIHPNAGRAASALPVPSGATRQQLALGRRIFEGQAAGGTCAGCHGADAKGTSVGPNLASGKFLWSDGSLAGIKRTIEQGVAHPKQSTGAMPPKGGAPLSPQDVSAVAAYVWALGHQQNPTTAEGH